MLAGLVVVLFVCFSASADAVGWQNSGGRWWYAYADGGYARDCWLKDGAWYHFDNEGWMQTGWLKSDGEWYYLRSSGAMAVGWVYVGDAWYYFDSSGAMAVGWVCVGDTWYYFYSSGKMAVGWVHLGDSWYYLLPSGEMAVGWVCVGDEWYYFLPSGAMATGWVQLGDEWYYLSSSGAMTVGWFREGEDLYYLGPSGALVNSWKTDVTEDLSGWELVQYPDLSGNVGMFYSLYNRENGDLILVDGGWDANAEQVSAVIESLGGKVKAWFLTHYHADHISVFNEIYEKYRDRIETVYINPLDWETFEQVAHSWDTPDAFSTFLEKTDGAENVVTLYAGDELAIDGLTIQVFSSFDEHVRELSTDWPNDSSIVFKVSTGEESVLFLGDLSRAGKPLGQYLIDTYGADKVRADFIQAGHHGNWGLSTDFYQQLKPKVLFQDAPEWLFSAPYDAKNLQKWCEENGIAVYDYSTAPNRFLLH